MSLRQLSALGMRAGVAAQLRPSAVAVSSRRSRKQKRPAVIVNAAREFHPSGRKEMLPIIGGALAVAAIATGLRYLVRAGRRMREMEEEEKARRRAGGSQGHVHGDAEDTHGPSDGPAFGIDVGVTNLRLAFSDAADKRPEVVENREGSRWTPAAVAFKDGEPVVGSLARAQRFEAASTTLAGVQPLLGLPFADPSWGDVATYSGAAGGGVFEGDAGMVGLRVGGEGGKVLTAEEIVGLMLGNMKELGEHKVATGGGAVLSCPGYFSDAQRDAMAGAGERAGLTVLDVIDEPTAAVLAAKEMSLLPAEALRGLVAVLDVGGRTTQCSIVDMAVEDGALPKLVATDWTLECGGDQWDAVLVDSLDTEFRRNNGGMSIKGDMMACTRLFDAATAARIELSRVQMANVNLPFITADQTGPKHLDVTMSRARVDMLLDRVLKKVEAPCAGVLSMAGVDASSLSAVLVIGGCCRSPALQDVARRVFGKAGGGSEGAIVSPEQSEEMIVLGAAVEARNIMFA